MVYRENVARLSDWYVFAIPAITAALKQVLGLATSSSLSSSAWSTIEEMQVTAGDLTQVTSGDLSQ